MRVPPPELVRKRPDQASQTARQGECSRKRVPADEQRLEARQGRYFRRERSDLPITIIPAFSLLQPVDLGSPGTRDGAQRWAFTYRWQ
jgi:hypothetical protein